MVFSSIRFVLIFLPIFFGVYYIVPDKFKNPVLLLGSLIFYFIGTIDHPAHFILLLISVLVDFFAGLLMEKYHDRKKIFLVAGVVFHLICLSVCKYSGFAIGELNRILSVNIPFNASLPIGISFYTFQGISYIADVYRGTVPAEKSLLNYAVYITMFEQLIAGPIVTYGQVQKQLHSRKIKTQNALRGIGIFIFGLGLKVLLANPLGKMWSGVQAIGFESISTPLAWLAILAYSLQLYFDFFGYSLMAIGLGKMLGFNLPKNFSFPYLSLSMTQFWRRWHITLGSWFRDYVYIPLGGNRRGDGRTVLNTFIVWMLTGIWHGAGYNFILWGFVLFLILLIEKFYLKERLDKKPVLGHIYMMFLIPVTWAIFAIDDINALGVFFSRLFPVFGQSAMGLFRYDFLKYLKSYWAFLVIGVLFSTHLPYNILKRIKNRVVIWLILAVILAASIYCMARGFDDPFLYFRF